uniref:Uncharacterized protein n=1 Tax=Strigamia maritima TaxID=126957 RepID=T1IXY7_STRMM
VVIPVSGCGNGNNGNPTTPRSNSFQTSPEPCLHHDGMMEALVKEMQHEERGVPVRCQKVFLSHIPCAFMDEFVIGLVKDVKFMEYQSREKNTKEDAWTIIEAGVKLSGYDLTEWLMDRLKIEDAGRDFTNTIL